MAAYSMGRDTRGTRRHDLIRMPYKLPILSFHFGSNLDFDLFETIGQPTVLRHHTKYLAVSREKVQEEPSPSHIGQIQMLVERISGRLVPKSPPATSDRDVCWTRCTVAVQSAVRGIPAHYARLYSMIWMRRIIKNTLGGSLLLLSAGNIISSVAQCVASDYFGCSVLEE